MTVSTGNDYIVTVGGVVKDITGRLEALERVGINSDIIVMPDGSTVNPGDLGIGDGSVAVYVQSNAPTGLNQSTDIGDLWYDTSNNNAAYWWDGFTWLPYGQGSPIYDGALGLGALGPSIVARNLTHFVAYTGGSQPGSPNYGDLWKDINNSNQVNHWNGSSWDVVTDTVILNDLDKAFTDADVSDGHITVYYLADPPVGPNATTDQGDLWYDTDNHYSPHTWNGSGWVDWSTQQQQVGTTDGFPPSYSPTPTLHGGIGTIFVEWTEVPNADTVSYYIYISTTSPVATDSTTYVGNTSSTTVFVINSLQDGTLLDPTVTYHVVIIARDPDGPAPVSGEATGSPIYTSLAQLEQTVQTKLNGIGSNGASKVYWQGTAPTGGSYAVGDTWFNTANGYAISQWNGTQWVLQQLGGTALADNSITSTQLASGVNTSITNAQNKNQMYFQTTTPTGGTYVVNDIWFDTGNGYAPYTWNGTTWAPYTFGTPALTTGSITSALLAGGAVTTTALADGSVSAAKIISGTITQDQLSTGLNDKINSAGGGSNIFYQATAPTGGTYLINDIWFNTSNGNEPYYWNGTQWVAFQYGTGAIAAESITATQIASQTIVAGNIAAGTITAAQIATDTITANQIAAGAIGADEIAANAVVAGKIAAGAVTAGTIAAGAVTAGTIAAGAITTQALSVGALQGNMVPNGNFTDGADANGVPNGWHVVSGTGTTTVSLATDPNSPSGDNVMNIGPAGANAGQFVLCTAFPIIAGKNYSLHVSAKHSDGTGMCFIYVVSNSTQPAGGFSTTNAYDGADGSGTASASVISGTTYYDVNTWMDGSTNTDVDGNGTTASWAWVYIRNYNSTGTLTVGAVEVREQSTSTMIADGAITTSKVFAQAITAGQIAAGTITANEIAANTITGNEIYTRTITASNIAVGTITGDRLYANTITGDKIAAGTITGSLIAGSTITGDKISATAIDGKTIRSVTLNSSYIYSSNLYSAYISSPNIQSGTLNSTSIYTTNIYGAYLQTDTAGQYLEIGNTGANDSVDEVRSFNYGTVSSMRNWSNYPGGVFFSMQGGGGGNGQLFIYPRDYNANMYIGSWTGAGIKCLGSGSSVQARNSYDGSYTNFVGSNISASSTARFKRNIRAVQVNDHKSILKGASFKRWNRPYSDMGIPQMEAADALDFVPGVAGAPTGETVEQLRARGEAIRAQRIAEAKAEADRDHYGLVLEELPDFIKNNDEHYSLPAAIAFLWSAATDLHDRIDALEARLPNGPNPPTPQA